VSGADEFSSLAPPRLFFADQKGAPPLAAPDEPPPTPFLPDPPPDVEHSIGGRIDRADIPELCDRTRAALETEPADRLVCDVGAVVAPDAVTVDALARIQLTARRLGRRVWLRHASPELEDLLALMGLSDAVPVSEASGLEVKRYTEERKVRGGVEEEADPADPVA
jgi:anti-anti-sigma regulatory factor